MRQEEFFRVEVVINKRVSPDMRARAWCGAGRGSLMPSVARGSPEHDDNRDNDTVS